MNYFKDKKVLVTGGTGFIGSHLTNRLIELGAIVSITTRNKNSDMIKNYSGKINIFQGDLNNNEFCINATKNQEIVLNLAADVNSVDYRKKHPALMELVLHSHHL